MSSNASSTPTLGSSVERVNVLGTRIHLFDQLLFLQTLMSWAREGMGQPRHHRRQDEQTEYRGRSVYFCNVHSLITARDQMPLRQALAEADAAVCDGMPVAWMCRWLAKPQQTRLSGPDTMWALLGLAAEQGVPVFFYGSSEQTLKQLHERCMSAFPRLKIAGAVSPPYRPLSQQEQQAYLDQIVTSGAGLVFIGLGCPKQEVWIHQFRDAAPVVWLGVGAAFDYHAGVISRAPSWLQSMGLEWLHRLFSEPKRLWRRYLSTNTRFIVLAIKQFLQHKLLGRI